MPHKKRHSFKPRTGDNLANVLSSRRTPVACLRNRALELMSQDVCFAPTQAYHDVRKSLLKGRHKIVQDDAKHKQFQLVLCVGKKTSGKNRRGNADCRMWFAGHKQKHGLIFRRRSRRGENKKALAHTSSSSGNAEKKNVTSWHHLGLLLALLALKTRLESELAREVLLIRAEDGRKIL